LVKDCKYALILLTTFVAIILLIATPIAYSFGASAVGNYSIRQFSQNPANVRYPTVNLTNPAPQADGQYGQAVAVSGKVIVVGEPYETYDNARDTGVVWIFNSMGNPEAALQSPNVTSGGQFGYSLAVGNGVFAVGAPGENSSTGVPVAGAVYLYSTSAKQGYPLEKYLESPTPVEYGEFGFSVAISNGQLAVGGGGEVCVYNISPPHLDYVLRNPTKSDQYFGSSISIGSGKVVVGAPSASVKDTGNVYVFSSTNGKYLTTLSRPGPKTYSQFGGSVSIGDGFIGVGSDTDYVQKVYEAGHVYLFSSTTYKLTHTLISNHPVSAGLFGYDLAIANGNILIGEEGNGTAFVFSLKSGALISVLLSGDENQGGFGCAVAASGDSYVVGALVETVGGMQDAGNAYLFS
jgi:hypothetical protein